MSGRHIPRHQKRMAGAGCLILSAATVLPSCGNLVYTDIEGQTGVGRSESGDIEIHVQPCGTKVDYIAVSGKFEYPTSEASTGSVPPEGGNPDFGRLKANKPQRDPFVVNLNNPPAPWKIESPINLPADESTWLLISATPTSQDKETARVVVQKQSILQLQPGDILIGKSADMGGSGTSIVTQEEFNQCAD